MRRWLIEERSEFRSLMVKTMLDDGPESAKYAWTETSKSIDPLVAGEACRVHRCELPDGHPVRALGAMDDDLLLGADNVLRPAEVKVCPPRWATGAHINHV